MSCRLATKFDLIERRVNSKPGEPFFSPSYMYRDTYQDATYLIARVKSLEAALELIAAPKRPDGTYNRCREACEQVAKDALNEIDKE